MNFFDKLKIIIPFTYIWFLRFNIKNPKTILDVGCGDGSLMEVLSQGEKWKVTGIDIFPKNIKIARQKDLYIEVIQGDLNLALKNLIKKKKKYDLVFCSQVIEHITRKKGEELLILVESLAKQRILIGTPRGFMHQPEVFLGDNPHQVHKSGWLEKDFSKFGYRIYGIGFFPLWSEEGLVHNLHAKLLMPIYFVISFILSPVVYFFPSIAAGILCVKDKKNE